MRRAKAGYIPQNKKYLDESNQASSRSNWMAGLCQTRAVLEDITIIRRPTAEVEVKQCGIGTYRLVCLVWTKKGGDGSRKEKRGEKWERAGY